jgi:DnaJ-class molecular chaperone
MKKKTLYEFLGVASDAHSDEIKAAALHLAKKFHPAKYPNNPRVAARFQQIKKVYRILANPEKRAAYDAMLLAKMAKATSANTRNTVDRSSITNSHQRKLGLAVITSLWQWLTRRRGKN